MIGVILRRPINHESGGHVRLTKSVLFFNMLACLSVCTIKQPSPFPASTRCTKTKGNIKPMECIDCVSMAHRHKHHESVDGRRIFVFVLFFCLCVLTTTKPTTRHTSVSFCKVLCSQQAQTKEQHKKKKQTDQGPSPKSLLPS